MLKTKIPWQWTLIDFLEYHAGQRMFLCYCYMMVCMLIFTPDLIWWHADQWQLVTCISYFFVLHVPVLQWALQWTKGLRVQWPPQSFTGCFNWQSCSRFDNHRPLGSLLCCSCWFFHVPPLSTKFTTCKLVLTFSCFILLNFFSPSLFDFVLFSCRRFRQASSSL